MNGHLEKDLSNLKVNLNWMKFEIKKLKFMHFHRVLQVIFIFIF
jgi:hypothetical protein